MKSGVIRSGEGCSCMRNRVQGGSRGEGPGSGKTSQRCAYSRGYESQNLLGDGKGTRLHTGRTLRSSLAKSICCEVRNDTPRG